MAARIALISVIVILTCSGARAQEAVFKDPLDHPAQIVKSIEQRPFLGISSAGKRIVAAGSRGLIVLSDDGGATWTQAKTPVQSDLVAVHFRSASRGWAVGHDGVVLNTISGGASWAKQLDGRIALKAFLDYYRNLPRDQGSDIEVDAAAKQVERNLSAGPALPFLDVWFDDDEHGYAVGSFGMIAATTDGGKSWHPWLHRIENEDWLNLNSIRGIQGDIYITSEQGVVFRLDRKAEKFRKIKTGYAGSFFGLVGDESNLLAYGLRGTVYRSEDQGGHWAPLEMPSSSTITGGAGSVGGARFVLVNDVGQMLVSDESGRDFRVVQPKKPMLLTGALTIEKNELILIGLSGLSKEVLRNDKIQKSASGR